jgi:hypothetical protein
MADHHPGALTTSSQTRARTRSLTERSARKAVTCFKLPTNARCAARAKVLDRSSRSSITWTAARPHSPRRGAQRRVLRHPGAVQFGEQIAFRAGLNIGGGKRWFLRCHRPRRPEQAAEVRDPQVAGCQRVRRRPVARGRQAIADRVKPHRPKLITAPELLGDPMNPDNRRHSRVVARPNCQR